ncbi:hypothetical protein KSF_084860 [Reticulibacter mediterranei]|uniref:Uncharacterized protein n=2 Tax=Reticulibacter mediterranei TaxID=2778369 RepID=A0A8J3N7B6_9CHLR|nr:hypothetical protein KSF_084860 [Reticulibacter mediterranei]
MPKGKQRAMQDELPALQERGEMKSQEIAPAEPLAYEIGMENYLPYGEEKPHQLRKAPQQRIQEYMNSQEMEVVTEQIAFMMYVESFRDGGEEGLRQLQHDFPETYKIAIRHIQRMREQGELSEQ